MSGPVRVRELAAWGFDAFAGRPEGAERLTVSGPAYALRDAKCPQDASLEAAFEVQRSRADLLEEMRGLTWELGMTDLRELLAFQRRLSFDAAAPALPTATLGDTGALLKVCFGPQKPVQYRVAEVEAASLILESVDPNFQLRLSAEGLATVCSGSPFMEVAEYRGRWFLRDGYHRAYHLQRAGINVVPAVIVHAKTLAELGADQRWFFPEDVLFSDRPPRVMDFLDDALVCEYDRPRLIKTIRLTTTTSYKTEDETGDQA